MIRDRNEPGKRRLGLLSQTKASMKRMRKKATFAECLVCTRHSIICFNKMISCNLKAKAPNNKY